METTPVWLIPLLTCIGGLVAGLILARLLRRASPESTQNRLDDLQERFDSYQNEVVAHFSTTAELVNRLTENYQNVQEHLMHSAERLALDESTRQRLLNSLIDQKALERQPATGSDEQAASTQEPAAAATETEEKQADNLEPPRDYACKKEGEVGTLDASFGHKKKAD